MVNAQADAQRRAEAGVHSIAIHIAVTLSGKPDISTGHHNFIIGLQQTLLTIVVLPSIVATLFSAKFKGAYAPFLF
ncbi:hypothetical protein EWF37_19950 [Salmonella enterica subsp. enterica]|nr:hypothetical protein [Salmonella enterica subsp. enterica serovar Typhimurium str. UK-1]EBY3294563.1 hypothetical protein [Salmonella enterica subsp. enterica serovar Emek]ECC9197264.1 hypothetical protein [Salmonella enterica subsp. enterica]ECJ5012855.1 hypothetical protein [Salmonella enterica subsp. enterica]